MSVADREVERLGRPAPRPRWHPALVPAIDERRATGRSAGHRTWHSRYLQRLIPIDALAGIVAGTIGLVLEWNSPMDGVYTLAIPFIALVWVLALALADAYGRRRLTMGSEQLQAVARAGLMLVAVVAIVAYVGGVGPAREYLFTVVAILVASALGARLALRRWLRGHRANGQLMQRTVVVGRADSAKALVHSLTADRSQGLLPVAVCATDLQGRAMRATTIDDVPVVGGPEDAIRATDLVDAEVVAVASHPDLAGASLRRLA